MSWIFVKQASALPPAVFSPQSLSGLVCWYDMSQQEAQSDDTEMSVLTDFSGAGRHLTGYGATKPKFRTALVNGMPGVQFNGSGLFWGTNWVTGEFPLLVDPITVCHMITLPNTFVNSGVVFGFEHRPAPTASRLATYSHFLYSNPFGGFRTVVALDRAVATQAGYGSTPGRGYPAIYVSSKDEAGLVTYAENGTAQSLIAYRQTAAADGVRTSVHDWTVSYPTVTTRATGILIGGEINNPQTPSFNGLAPSNVYHYETAVFGRVLTLDEMNKMEGYLAHKWGLAGSLPVGHPYKSAAPTA